MDNGNDNNRNNRRPIGGQNNGSYPKYGSNGYSNNRPPMNRYVEGGPNNGQYNSNHRRVANNGSNSYNQVKGLEEEYNNDSAIIEGDGMGTDKMDPEDKKKLIKKRIKLGIKIFLVSMLLGVIVAGIIVYVKYGKEIMEMRDEAIAKVDEKSVADFKKSSQHKYYGVKTGENGEKQYVELDMGSDNSKYISISEGGENMVLARELMICSEDRNYYSHQGVDLWASTKAVILAIMKGGEATRGGSTITQQLARNVILEDFDKTWRRKVREIFVSWELNDKFSKDEIIEFYLNNINYGNGYMGIENAAYGYFGKSVKELSKGQVAFLCAIPNNPSMFNPYDMTSNNAPKNKSKNATEYKVNYNTSVRKNRLLEQMDKYSKTKLDKADFTAAINEKIEVVAQENQSTKGDKYVVDRTLKEYINQCVYDKIIKQSMQSFTFEYPDEWATQDEKTAYEDRLKEARNRAYNLLKESKTMHIYTSLDLDMIDCLQEAINTGVSNYGETKYNKKEPNVFAVQSAGVTIDDSGYVVAMVNGRDNKDNAINWLGRAFDPTKNLRQPGSSIKPLVVYGPYFEENADKEGFCFLDEQVDDSGPLEINGSKPIRNSGKVYGKSANIRDAIKHSSNVVAYRTLESIGFRKGINYLKKMNIANLSPNENARIAIGATVDGVTPLQMCAAYGYILMDMGAYIRPTCVKVISDKKLVSQSEVDTHSQAKQSGERTIFSEDTKSRLIEGMKTVLEPGGTAARVKLSGGWEAAGKTGTTDDNVDSWFCGGTAKYTTAIWVGNEEDRKIKTAIDGPDVSGIWSNYYNAIAKISRIKSELDSKAQFTYKYTYSQTILPHATEDPFATFDPNGEMPTPSETTYTFMPSFSPDPDDTDGPSNPRQTPSPEPGLPTIPGSQTSTPYPADDDDDDNSNNGNSNGNHGNNNGNNNSGPSRP